MDPWTLVSPGERRADVLARRGELLVLPAIPCSVFPLTSRIHSSRFSSGGVLPHRILRPTGSLDIHRGACASSSRSLCALPSSLQLTQPFVKLISRIEKIENPSCSGFGDAS